MEAVPKLISKHELAGLANCICMHIQGEYYIFYVYSMLSRLLYFYIFLETYCFQRSDRKKCRDSVIISSTYNNKSNSIVTIDRFESSITQHADDAVNIHIHRNIMTHI